MVKSICAKYCPVPFCQTACPVGAISSGVKGSGENIRIDLDRCHGCGICRVACITLSRDRTLERKLPWISPA